MTSVDFGGYTPDALLAVDDGQRSGGRLSKATIEVGATPANRSNIEDGDEVTITRDGEVTFSGYVMGRPSKGTDGILEVGVMDKRLELKHIQVNRTFNGVDTGQAVKDAVNYEASPSTRRSAFLGDSLDDWESDAPVMEAYTASPSGDADTNQIWEYGNDAVFIGVRSGASGDYYARRTGIPSDVTYGVGGLRKALLRFVMNDPGGQMSVEFEIRDDHGRNFVWEIEGGRSFEEVELAAEDASPDGNISSGPAAEFRVSISGEIGENRGIIIDSAHTVPYRNRDRNTGITTNNVEATGRSITRRIDASAMEFIKNLATEDRHEFWIDDSDDLHYEPSGGEVLTDLQIVEGTTAVTDYDIDRNAEQVRNKVTVQGKDVEVTAENPASIQFYGVAPRTEPIVDKSIQTRDGAERRGRGFLEENAWNGSVAEFEVADTDYQSVGVSDSLLVQWPSEGIDGDYVVRDKTVDKAGIVTLTLGVGVRGS